MISKDNNCKVLLNIEMMEPQGHIFREVSSIARSYMCKSEAINIDLRIIYNKHMHI